MKKIFSVWAFILVIMSLTACGAKKTMGEDDVKSELESYCIAQFDKNETVTSIDLDKRQTDEEHSIDRIWCTIHSEDGEKSYQKGALVTYMLYDDGWKWEDVDIDSSSDWVVKPLKGANEAIIKDALYGSTVQVGDEAWQITQDSLMSASITSQTTDLEKGADDVVMSIQLDDEVERAEGEIEVALSFDDEWKFDRITSESGMTAEIKDDRKPDFSEDKIVDAIMEHDIPFNALDNNQRFSFSKSEVSNFEVGEPEVNDKGKSQTVKCSFDVNKSLVTMKVNATVKYDFVDEWKIRAEETTSEALSADFVGDWTGKSNWFQRAEFDISEIKDDGTVTGVYSWYNDGNGFENASFTVKGKLDLPELVFTIENDEWVEEPSKRPDRYTGTIILRYKIDDTQLKGKWKNATIYLNK